MKAPSPAQLKWMDRALVLARKAEQRGDVPVGALIEIDGRLIATAYNETRRSVDPTAHAEILVLRAAAKVLGNERLLGTTLYVTKEPCAMCAGAIVHARVSTLVFGCEDTKAGACGSVIKVIPNRKLNHRPVVIKRVRADESAALLKGFFRRRR